jgi:ERCC4-type nuclease
MKNKTIYSKPKSYSNKSKERTDKKFEEDIKEAFLKNTPGVPKTNYCGLLGTKEGMEILKKMSWIEIEELTDYEFY